MSIYGEQGSAEFRTPFQIILGMPMLWAQTIQSKFAQYAIQVHMHNDFGRKQPVQSHEPNALWGDVYISIDVHIQNHDHFIDA